MKRIKCKSTTSKTVAKNGSNLMNGRHARAAAKRAKRNAAQ